MDAMDASSALGSESSAITNLPDLLTVAEVAQLFEVDTSIATGWVEKGWVQPVQLPTTEYLIPKSEVTRIGQILATGSLPRERAKPGPDPLARQQPWMAEYEKGENKAAHKPQPADAQPSSSPPADAKAAPAFEETPRSSKKPTNNGSATPQEYFSGSEKKPRGPGQPPKPDGLKQVSDINGRKPTETTTGYRIDIQSTRQNGGLRIARTIENNAVVVQLAGGLELLLTPIEARSLAGCLVREANRVGALPLGKNLPAAPDILIYCPKCQAKVEVKAPHLSVGANGIGPYIEGTCFACDTRLWQQLSRVQVEALTKSD